MNTNDGGREKTLATHIRRTGAWESEKTGRDNRVFEMVVS